MQILLKIIIIYKLHKLQNQHFNKPVTIFNQIIKNEYNTNKMETFINNIYNL